MSVLSRRVLILAIKDAMMRGDLDARAAAQKAMREAGAPET
jgi:hypothetical protein